MSINNWSQLAITSIRKPADAAQVLLAMGLDSRTLWNALVLVAVGNTLLYSLSVAIFPEPAPMSAMLSSPFVYFAIVAGGLTLTAVSITWVGNRMGGKGRLVDVLVLVVWMQALRLLVQAVVLVLVFVMPAMSALLVLAAALIGIYMLVHFIDQAHGFQSTGRSAFVLILSMLAIVVGLSLILTLFGGFAMGIMPDV